MLTVTPDDVPGLIPGAPYPEAAHVSLALVWARTQLALRRVDPDTLSGDALLAARTGVAARALALKAGIGGVVSLEGAAVGGAARVIESVRVPDEIEVKYRAPQSTDTALALAADGWDATATYWLQQVPGRGSRVVFPGAAR